MGNSSTSHKLWVVLPLFAALPFRCFGAEANNSFNRVRERWGPDSGFPSGPVYAISQSRDGYLWIGTEKGLVRFDGQSFRIVENVDSTQPVHPVLGLTPDGNGDLWVRLRRPTLLRFSHGKFDNPMAIFGRAGTTVAASSSNHEGELVLWILKREATAVVLRNKQFQTLSAPVGFSRSPVLAFGQLSNGELWVGTRDAGLFRLRGNESTPISKGLPDPKVNCLLPSARGQIWIGTDNGLTRWDGRELTNSGIPTALRQGRILALSEDRHFNLWIGTNSQGLVRLDSNGNLSPEDGEGSGEAVTALFQDREGSIWVGRTSSLERIRISPFSVLERTRGIEVGPVYADAAGGIWTAPLTGGLVWTRGSVSRRISHAGLDREVVLSIAGSGNQVWAGRRNGNVTRLQFDDHGVKGFATYDRTRGLPGNAVSTIHCCSSKAIWAGTLGGGAFRLEGSGFVAYTTAQGLASNVITSIADTRDGTMWFGTPRGLSSMSPDFRTASFREELPSANVQTLFTDSKGVLWIGTAGGLARWNAGKLESLARVLSDSILGIAEDRLGWLWIATDTRMLSVDRQRLENRSVTALDFREYGKADGLTGASRKRTRSVVADASGRIWFSTYGGVSLFDPDLLRDAGAPAIVDIHTVSADGDKLGFGATVQVPPGRRRIMISYAGLSLATPERVRFRYRLDDFDKGWSEPVAAREAIYTNLSPGRYTFHVIASNPDGVWNGQEATIAIRVEPPVWQTWWFRGSVIVAALSATAMFYRRRLNQLTRQLNIRFEERLAERTRIAQELHDTLLQGFLSASMQLHVAADQLPEDSAVKSQLSRVLDLMRQVIEEGRNAVRGLRSSKSNSLDLEEALSQVQQELGREDVDYQVVSIGSQQPLHPMLRDEVYRIGREAVLNAFHHSGASKIEVDVQYRSGKLRMLIHDNGCGIDPEVLKNGREGHWGLSGMRERAQRIGARFHVWSSARTGTKIELDVPGHIAFRANGRVQPGWIQRFHPLRTFRSGRNT